MWLLFFDRMDTRNTRKRLPRESPRTMLYPTPSPPDRRHGALSLGIFIWNRVIYAHWVTIIIIIIVIIMRIPIYVHGDFSDVTNGEKKCFPTRLDGVCVCVIIIISVCTARVWILHVYTLNIYIYIHMCTWRSRTGCSPRDGCYETRNPRRGAPVPRHPVAAR